MQKRLEKKNDIIVTFISLIITFVPIYGAPDKPCGVGRADANPKLLLNDT